MKNKLWLMMAAMVVAGYAQSAIGQNLDEGLVAYYPFNGNANDESGNGNDGTILGGALVAETYLDLEDGNGHVEFNKQLIPINGEDYTVYLRVNPDKNKLSSISEVISQGSGAGAFFIGVFRDGTIRISDRDSTVKHEPDDLFHDILLKHHGKSNMTDLYYDGQKVYSGNSQNVTSGGNNTRIGRQWDANAGPEYFDGKIDEVRIYNRALSESEVAALYELDSTPPPPPFDPEEGLVAYYPFNGNANDESGNEYDGTVNGATLTEDRFGSRDMAYSFDGDDSILLDDGLKEFAPTSYQGLTFSFWSEADSAGYIITQYVNMNAGQSNFFTAIRPDLGVGGFHLSGNGTSTFTSTVQGESNDWNHWIIEMFPGENNVKITRNGILERQGTVNLNGSISSTRFQIGTIINSLNPGPLIGQIDDIRIYDRSFSEEEVYALYELESKPPFDPEEGLVAYYPFNGNAKDASGNEYDGTVNGATLTEDRFGSRDRAYSFGGNGEYIDLGEPQGQPESLTTSAWIRRSVDGNVEWIISRSQWVSGAWQLFTKSGKVWVEFGPNTWPMEGTTNIADNKWHQIVCIYDYSSNKRYLYVDGKLEGESTKSAFTENTGRLLIGMRDKAHPDSGSTFNGSIDDVRIYNRALSEEEVAALYELESKLPSGLSPVIFDHPIGIDLRRDESVVLSVGHTGTPSFDYQWSQGGIKLQGQTKPYLFLEAVTPWDSGNYTVSISNLWGTATSNSAKIIVTGPPDILAHPISVVAGVGSNLFLSVQADGTPPLSYQWYKNGVALEGGAKAS